MPRLLPFALLTLLFCGVTLSFALAMGQVRADWLAEAVMLAVGLGMATAALLPVRG